MNNNNAFIFHGTMGSPDENWLPWLAKNLKKEWIETTIPTFPTPDNQSLESWLDVMDKYVDEINENTILIGHSLGATFLLRLLEALDKPIKIAVLVSGLIGTIDFPEFDELNSSFIEHAFDWEKIKNNAGEFMVVHGKNDPYVPTEHAHEIAKQTGAGIHIIENGGHLNTAAGYSKFNKLFDLLLDEIY
ncbi:MAG: serine hydrolase family protein [Alphaproteobacteria bacterium]|nr:serine hydrolase family protein [Alphaproteobacteria bacterium]